MRFHSLPGSKRYPDDAAEYAIVLHRYNTVLDELFAGQDVRIVTTNGSAAPEPPALSARHARWHPGGARHWTSFRVDEDETDPDFVFHTHLHVSHTPWRTGMIDDLLRAVADDQTAGVMITSPSFDRIHHPYDGGADIFLPTTPARDAMKSRHVDWLSKHSLGY